LSSSNTTPQQDGAPAGGSRWLLVQLAVMHWLVTLIGVALAASAAQTAAANGVPGLGFALKLLFGVVIAFCLPLVYPLLTFADLHWWTGGGFLALALTAALNSILVVGAARLAIRFALGLRRR
jgi:hypothetical protein